MSIDFNHVEQAIKDYQQGKMLILVDDESRENEGDLVIAAEHITPEAINFMATEARGLICLPMDEELINRLNIPMMVAQNTSPYETAFTVSIEAKTGVSTGISAKDRATTIKTAIAEGATPTDIVTPGHVFPLKAKKHGVLARRGQTEGSVDLARLAGLTPAAVICEIINTDGTMARRDELEIFAKKYDIRIVSIEELYHYRQNNEISIIEQVKTTIPLNHLGDFDISVFSSVTDDIEHVALVKGPITDNALVRVHSECLTGDIFGSAKCDCGHQLQHSLETIAKEGGVLLYMRQEGRGIGLVNKLKAYALQKDKGLDTVEANLHLGFPEDARDYAVSAQILRYLGVNNITLLTNNPRKIEGLSYYGINVAERRSLTSCSTKDNEGYLQTKKEKLGHLLADLMKKEEY